MAPFTEMKSMWEEGTEARKRKELSLDLLGMRCLTDLKVKMWRVHCNICL